MAIIENVSEAARIAGPSEDVSLAELQLAARNHALPLEALRYDITPAGLHYLLIHFDIPYLDPDQHVLTIQATTTTIAISLAELRKRPRVTSRVSLECAGNGRALLRPRPVS